MTSLYDLLGSAPGATEEQLRQAYRRAARQVHPDVNPSPDSDAAIRQLNQAWAVLGDPERRRHYDAEIGVGADPAAGRAPSAPPSSPTWNPVDVETLGRRSRLWRPSVVVVGILAIIFVVTAYAGSHDHQGRSPLPPSPASQTTQPTAVAASPEQPEASVGNDGAAGVALVGKCILRLLGYDAVVVCNQPGAQMIEAEVANSSDCPAGTTVYQLEGRSQLVCLAAKG